MAPLLAVEDVDAAQDDDQGTDSGLGRAEALRQAMLALIDGPGFVDGEGRSAFVYAHPLFWAPFSVVGDGGGGTPKG